VLSLEISDLLIKTGNKLQVKCFPIGGCGVSLPVPREENFISRYKECNDDFEK
jgi:hypothetical protein